MVNAISQTFPAGDRPIQGPKILVMAWQIANICMHPCIIVGYLNSSWRSDGGSVDFIFRQQRRHSVIKFLIRQNYETTHACTMSELNYVLFIRPFPPPDHVNELSATRLSTRVGFWLLLPLLLLLLPAFSSTLCTGWLTYWVTSLWVRRELN